jgi:hypothetical protein
MSKLELLRDQVHELVDQFADEEAMTRLHETAVELLDQHHEGNNDLTEAERKLIQEAYEETLDPTKRIPHEVVKNQFTKWLTR